MLRLAETLLQRLCQRHRSGQRALSPLGRSRLLAYPWPGNARELRNAVERMVFTAQAGVVGPFVPDAESEASRLLSLPTTAGRLKEVINEIDIRKAQVLIEAALIELSRQFAPEQLVWLGRVLDRDSTVVAQQRATRMASSE